MQQQTRRERKKEETRRRILDAAFKLFVEQGFENTTVDQITVTADVGKGTFYNYFPNREAALFEFVEDLGIRRGQKIWPGILKLQDTRQRLAKAFQSLCAWFEEYPELLRVYLTDTINKSLRNPANHQYNHLELFLTEIIKMGQDDGDIRDDVIPQQMVDHLMGITLIQLCRWFEGGAGPGLYELTMKGADFFLIGALSTEK